MPEAPLLPLHADLFTRAVVDTKELPWVESPEPTVQRKLIERAGGDGTRATSLVRFAAGATFPAHDHAGGEEFFVLEGEFCDETGCYPVGSWIRSPHDSHHTPFTRLGCTIFVKTGHLPIPDSWFTAPTHNPSKEIVI